MKKKMSMLALAGLIAIAPCALAGTENPQNLQQKVDELSRQIDQLRSVLAQQRESMKNMNGSIDSVSDKISDLDEMVEEKSESWDLAARVKLFGDFRARLDSHKSTVPAYWNSLDVARAMRGFGVTAATTPQGIAMAFAGFKQMALTPQARQMMMQYVGAKMQPEQDFENETLMTNRLRLNMRVKATENLEVKARLVGYKVWGMQSAATPENGDLYSPYFLNSRSFDGTSTRQPVDNAIRVDRAFANWNNIGGMPIWFSVGRRPTTDGPPAHLRMGMDKRMATPISYMDYPFDGISMGYAYDWGNDALGSGRIRFCYGRGFEAGVQADNVVGIDDTDFAGLSWDIMKSGSRFMNIQAFGAFNIFNIPGDTYYPNPMEIAEAEANPFYTGDTILDRVNLGDIYHTSIVYMDKVENLNYFLTLGWSHTKAEGIDEIGASLLGSWGAEPEDKDGYGLYAGIRYDLDDIGLKLGAEFNYGSENWLAFTPGHDDMYTSKLYTRGKVYEAYLVYDLPTGEAISKYAKTFIRLGYQYYDYDYTYSGMWLGTPAKIEDLQDPATAQFYAPMESASQVYLTFEAYF